ncbi:hypothetical protein RRG08_046253 [Elysia crispata]|uniref:Uncharacterized protein n=1 Tax=Elysia crispata TaxID=231223 RepID=A0AAE0YMT6_9GAST|nr:hypothetical protein RRG08_046253 [Elysia crispata]
MFLNLANPTKESVAGPCQCRGLCCSKYRVDSKMGVPAGHHLDEDETEILTSPSHHRNFSGHLSGIDLLFYISLHCECERLKS